MSVERSLGKAMLQHVWGLQMAQDDCPFQESQSATVAWRLAIPELPFWRSGRPATSPFILHNPHLVQRKRHHPGSCSKGICSRCLNLSERSSMRPAALKRQAKWTTNPSLKTSTWGKLVPEIKYGAASCIWGYCQPFISCLQTQHLAQRRYN